MDRGDEGMSKEVEVNAMGLSVQAEGRKRQHEFFPKPHETGRSCLPKPLIMEDWKEPSKLRKGVRRGS